jgi:hypothetical protein
MNSEIKPKSNSRRVFVIIIILTALFLGFFLYQSGSLGIGNSCNAVRNRYEKAKEVEDYAEVSLYYQKMNELGCEF